MKKTTIFLKILLCSISGVLLGSCYQNIYNHIDVVRTVNIDMLIPPVSDTSGLLTLGSGCINYDVDSFLKNDQMYLGNSYELKQLTKASVTSCFITIANATPSSSFANLSSCSAEVYTDVNPIPQIVSESGIPDLYNSELVFTTIPGDDLKQYFRNDLANVKTFCYGIKGKLRKPITDTLKCRITLVVDLHLDKATRAKVNWLPRK